MSGRVDANSAVSVCLAGGHRETALRTLLFPFLSVQQENGGKRRKQGKLQVYASGGCGRRVHTDVCARLALSVSSMSIMDIMFYFQLL